MGTDLCAGQSVERQITTAFRHVFLPPRPERDRGRCFGVKVIMVGYRCQAESGGRWNQSTLSTNFARLAPTWVTLMGHRLFTLPGEQPMPGRPLKRRARRISLHLRVFGSLFLVANPHRSSPSSRNSKASRLTRSILPRGTALSFSLVPISSPPISLCAWDREAAATKQAAKSLTTSAKSDPTLQTAPTPGWDGSSRRGPTWSIWNGPALTSPRQWAV